MIKTLRLFAGLLLAATLAACGGGGGSNGTPVSGGGGGGGGTGGGSTGSTGTPTLALSVVDSLGATVPGNAVASGTTVFAKAVVTDAAGAVVANKLVAFTSKSQAISFTPTSGQVLTDSTGTAKVQVAPATLSTAGADTLTASAIVGSATLSTSMDVQTSPANVTLANFSASTGSLTAFQSTAVGVDVAVNGIPATTAPVSVSFSASCGSFSPTSAQSNSTGRAVSTFQATGCSGGTATLTASAIGASAAQTAVAVLAPTPTNLLFMSATPPTIYSSVAAFGVKQSTVIFKVVDASGAAITSPTSVQVSLSSSAINSGVTFAETGTTAPRTVSTDATGQVSVIVQAGSVPTPLAVTAQLVSTPSITASSAGLSVNSGRPSQKFFSFSVGKHNIEGWSIDGTSTTVNVFAADRLGQPVPAGTPITFVTEGGQVTASCQILAGAGSIASCSGTYISQAFRPSNGRVTLLAYAEGEEAFDDANGNNKYDTGETFYDMGQPFIDANENGTFDTGEQKIGDASVAGSGIGSAACPAVSASFQVASVAGTCDGAWGATRVRQQQVIVLSTSTPGSLRNPATGAAGPLITANSINFLLADGNGNAMAYGTGITAAVPATTGSTCTAPQVIPATVPDSVNPTPHSIVLAGSCSGQTVNITITSPSGTATLIPVAIP